LASHRLTAAEIAVSGLPPQAAPQTCKSPDSQHATPMSVALSEEQREKFSAELSAFGCLSNPRAMSA
jgi:hypothetical protein